MYSIMDHVDWRAPLPLDSRWRIVNKILETLKMHLPHSAELENIAVRCEGDAYSAATSQNDYHRKISLKMLTLETQSQSAMANSPQTGAANAQTYLGSSGQCQQNPSSVGLMNGNNWWGSRVPMVQPQAGTVEHSALPSSASASPMVLDDWRAQISLESRQRIAKKILGILKKHLPYSGQEGLQELRKIAVRFEEKIYSAATSQSDYLRKISLKMLSMETKSQSPMANSPQTVAANASRNPSDLGSSGQCQQNPSSVGLMNGNNWWGSRVPMVQPQAGTVEHSALPSSASASPMVLDDWRAQIPLESRQRIANKILETLKKHLPYSGQEGLQELRKIAVRFEEKIYSAATSQSDYLRKISLKMLTMETKSQSPMANSPQTVAAKLSDLDINI